MAQVVGLLGLIIIMSVQENIVLSVPFTRVRRTISSSEYLSNETVSRGVEDSHMNLLQPSRRLKDSVIDPVFLLDRYSPSQVDRKVCQKPAKCVSLNYTTCMGTKLPYSQTTLDLVEGVHSQEQVQEHLQTWRGLVHLPKCWAVIQPLLCALYMPKCEGDRVDLPSHEMCKMILGPCRILTLEQGWPSVLKKCENQTEFPHGCKNDVRELKFNTTGRCREPMVQTDYPSSYYDGVEGCGVQCDNPLFTLDERNQIHRLVSWAATACFLFNLFTVVTFMIDWKSASKYPALVIFYINFCFLIVCIGWLAQFLPGGREDIVCRKDGTLRVGEPSAGENLSCVVVFVLVYYFLMAGIVWFVILTYAWHISFQALGKIQERMDKKGAYFHLVAWSLPLVLTITTMALGEIDGNSVSGVCFVGTINHAYRAGFLLVPVFAALTVGGYFLSKVSGDAAVAAVLCWPACQSRSVKCLSGLAVLGSRERSPVRSFRCSHSHWTRALITLIRLKISSQEIISERASAKIRETIVRMGFFSLLIFTFGITTFVCHIHEFRNSASWSYSFRKFIVCRLGVTGTEPSECRMESRPSLAILQLHLLALFATGIVMSSWVWTSSTFDTWTRFVRRITKKEIEEPVKVKKHKVIARAFAKRKMLNSTGCVSISIHNTYQDPVGLNFELNSLASGELSSTWTNALPKLVTRRGALVGVGTNSNSSQRRNSIDSEISYSVRRVSVESRRHSLDSAVSVQVAELTQTVRKASRPSHRVRNKRSRRRENRHKTSAGGISSCRWSTTSQESQLGAQILSALSIGKADIPPVTSMVPNLKRRNASAGLDDSLNILAGKLFNNLSGHLGFNLPSGSGDSSKEEEEEIECKGETRVTKAVDSDDSEESESDEKEDVEDESGKEEKGVSEEEEKEPLKSSRHGTESRMSKSSGRSRKKSSLLFDDINIEDGRRSSKRRDTDSRNSKLSDRSDRSRQSKRTIDGENEMRRNNRRNREKKWDSKNCPSGGSDFENCTDDLKWIQSEGEGRNSSLQKVSIGVTTDSSFCPELYRLFRAVQSSPGASIVGYPYQGREIGTQTSVSIDNSEHSVSEEVLSKPNRKKHKTKSK